MAAGGQDQAVGRAISSIQDASMHMAQLLSSAAVVKEFGLITLNQFPQCASRIEATQRKIRSDVDRISAELPNDMRTCVERIQTCSEEFLQFSEAYSSRYEGGWINAFFRWLSLNRDIHAIQQYLQYLADNVQRVIDPVDSLNEKLMGVRADLAEDLTQLGHRQDEYHRLVKRGKEQELKDTLAEINSRYYHALLGFGGSVIGAVAVGGIAIWALKKYIESPEDRALLSAGFTAVGVNEMSQSLPCTMNKLIQEGIMGNLEKWSKARDEWYELKQKLVDLRGGGVVFLHAELQQLSQLVEDLQGHLAYVIADWRHVRDQLQTATDQIKNATRQDQVAVILRNLKIADRSWKEAMDWAKACLPRPEPQRQ